MGEWFLSMILPASYSISVGTFTRGSERPDGKAGHPPPSGDEVKNVWSYTSTLSTRVHVVYRDFIMLRYLSENDLFVNVLCSFHLLHSWLRQLLQIN